ncbi:HK97 family phage prohead protease [Actinomyces ruminis]|uniref:HK97 family phage prohead protease n=1 Tax=Actinomyces ruminis TaxID=1937003 RepID=UPI000B6B19A0|nr:HK97 family phage prohead protease [Actinomyces ruminis]
MEFKVTPVRIKAGPEDNLAEGEFLVYPSTFTRTADAYGDVVAPGAFANTIKEWKESGNSLPGLYGHRMDDPDYAVAYALDMGEDDHGWWVHGAFDLDSPKGPQVYRLVKGRRLTQLSFAFDVIDSGAVTLDDGTKANELRELKVYEFSFVPVGANQDTSVVAVKDATTALTHSLKSGRVLARSTSTPSAPHGRPSATSSTPPKPPPTPTTRRKPAPPRRPSPRTPHGQERGPAGSGVRKSPGSQSRARGHRHHLIPGKGTHHHG